MNGMSRSKCCGGFGAIRKSSKVRPVLWKGSAKTETYIFFGKGIVMTRLRAGKTKGIMRILPKGR